MLQQQVAKATIETLRYASRVVALALTVIPWSTGNRQSLLVNFCDAAFAGESETSPNEDDLTIRHHIVTQLMQMPLPQQAPHLTQLVHSEACISSDTSV